MQKDEVFDKDLIAHFKESICMLMLAGHIGTRAASKQLWT